MSIEPGVIDANVLVYAFDPRAPQHAKSRSLLEKVLGEAPAPLYVTSQNPMRVLPHCDQSPPGHQNGALLAKLLPSFLTCYRSRTSYPAPAGYEARVRAYRGMLLVAMALRENGRCDDSIKELQRAKPLIDALLAKAPQDHVYLRLKMEAANYEGEAYLSDNPSCLSKPAEAAVAFQRYADIARQLLTLDPNNASAQLSLALAYSALFIAVGIDDPAQGLELAKTSVRLFSEGFSRRPNDRLLLSRRAHALRNLARAYWRTHNLHAARTTVEQAIHMHQELLSQSPNDHYEGAELIRSRQLLASLNDRTPIVKQ